MPTGKKMIPIFTTQGEVGAFLIYPYLYDLRGEWIGWVSAYRMVYSVLGYHVGILTMDPRILSPHSRSEMLRRDRPFDQSRSARLRLPLAP
jgi:hypothetical protein